MGQPTRLPPGPLVSRVAASPAGGPRTGPGTACRHLAVPGRCGGCRSCWPGWSGSPSSARPARGGGGHRADRRPGPRTAALPDGVRAGAVGRLRPAGVRCRHRCPGRRRRMWAAVNFLACCWRRSRAIFVRGALAVMQWMLNLTLYRDNCGRSTRPTQGVASAVFWPLIGCTVAAAGFTMYAGARREGRGSILGEAVKVAVLGGPGDRVGSAPSQVSARSDDARTAASNAVMTGYSRDHLAAGGAVAGFPPVTVPSGPIPRPAPSPTRCGPPSSSRRGVTPRSAVRTFRQSGRDGIARATGGGRPPALRWSPTSPRLQADSRPTTASPTFADGFRHPPARHPGPARRLAGRRPGRRPTGPAAAGLAVFGLLVAVGVSSSP